MPAEARAFLRATAQQSIAKRIFCKRLRNSREQDAAREDNLRECTKTYMTEGSHSATKYCKANILQTNNKSDSGNMHGTTFNAYYYIIMLQICQQNLPLHIFLKIAVKKFYCRGDKFLPPRQYFNKLQAAHKVAYPLYSLGKLRHGSGI